MKRLNSVILSVLILISVIFGAEVKINAAVVQRWDYCDICQERVYYLENERSMPVSCTKSEGLSYSCGHFKVTRPAREHSFGYGTVRKEQGIITYECTRCWDGYYSELLSEHKCKDFWYPLDYKPSCETPGREGAKQCKGCHTEYDATYIPALGHTLISNKDGKEPTCFESGYTDSYHCRRPGCDYITEREVIPALGKHTPVIDIGYEATCEGTGLSKGKHCSVCNEVFVAQKKIQAKGHDIETVDKMTSTYFEEGYTGDKVCKTCGEVTKIGKFTPKLKLKTPKATVKAGKKKLTVKYTKVKDATGFQVKYKIGKKSVTRTYNTKKTATKTIKNLKKGTYKVYVRAYIRKSNKIACSNWSEVKKVKVK